MWTDRLSNSRLKPDNSDYQLSTIEVRLTRSQIAMGQQDHGGPLSVHPHQWRAMTQAPQASPKHDRGLICSRSEPHYMMSLHILAPYPVLERI